MTLGSRKGFDALLWQPRSPSDFLSCSPSPPPKAHSACDSAIPAITSTKSAMGLSSEQRLTPSKRHMLHHRAWSVRGLPKHVVTVNICWWKSRYAQVKQDCVSLSSISSKKVVDGRDEDNLATATMNALLRKKVYAFGLLQFASDGAKHLPGVYVQFSFNAIFLKNMKFLKRFSSWHTGQTSLLYTKLSHSTCLCFGHSSFPICFCFFFFFV